NSRESHEMKCDREKLSEDRAAQPSRRRFLANLIAGAATIAGGAVTVAQGSLAKEKISKAAARYQDHPNKGQRCGGCAHFLFGGCELVAGSISSNGWCKLFKASA